ncbi:MAG: lysophospholipid acyltransferase family protein [Terrimicrobiaceae bacterium]|jgi:lauroyl/myristoyl acyltransferase
MVTGNEPARERSHTERLAYRLGYTSAAFSFLRFLSGAAGRSGSSLIAATFARCYCATQPGVVRVVARNLELLGHPAPCRSAPKVFENFARTLADYFWLAGRPREEAAALSDMEGPLPEIPAGCGAVLATGHFGFFEYGELVLGMKGIPVSVVTYAEPTTELTRWRADYRLRWGAETIELGGDTFSSLRAATAIGNGRLTAMLVDRPVGGRSLEVDLPGGRIPFSMAPALLSWMVGCPILPASVRRTPGGRYAVSTNPLLFADRRLPRDEALADCTRRVAGALIRDFQKDPLQWYHFVPLSP